MPLGGIQRRLQTLEQHVRVLAVLGGTAAPNGDAQAHCFTTHLKGLTQMLAQTLNPVFVIIKGRGANHQKLVTTEPTYHPSGHMARQALGKAGQQTVALLDTEAVVDRLETINVDDGHIETFARAQMAQT